MRKKKPDSRYKLLLLPSVSIYGEPPTPLPTSPPSSPVPRPPATWDKRFGRPGGGGGGGGSVGAPKERVSQHTDRAGRSIQVNKLSSSTGIF
jgi:hypothetical protein